MIKVLYQDKHGATRDRDGKLVDFDGGTTLKAGDVVAVSGPTEALVALEDHAKEVADKKAKKILSLAIQRFAGDYVAEKTINSVALPSDEMKGRIIGREGRNIRAIEAATGIDLIIDDTPEAVIISGFNPVRREVARLALEKLIADGRIHPARIEEVVKKAEQEVDSAIREAGDAEAEGQLAELGRQAAEALLSLGETQRAAELLHLAGLTELRHLDLWKASKIDAGLQYLAPMKHLHRLNLGDTREGAELDAGTVHLRHLVGVQGGDAPRRQGAVEGFVEDHVHVR